MGGVDGWVTYCCSTAGLLYVLLYTVVGVGGWVTYVLLYCAVYCCMDGCMGWKTYEYYNTYELPNQIRLKVALGPLSPTAILFSWVGIDFP